MSRHRHHMEEPYTLFCFDNPEQEENHQPQVMMQAPLPVLMACINFLSLNWVGSSERGRLRSVGMEAASYTPRTFEDKNGEEHTLSLPPRVNFLGYKGDLKAQDVPVDSWEKVKVFSIWRTSDFDRMFRDPQPSDLVDSLKEEGFTGDEVWNQEFVLKLCELAEDQEGEFLHALSWQYHRMGIGEHKATPTPLTADPSLN